MIYCFRIRNNEYRELLEQNNDGSGSEYEQRNILLQRQRRMRHENVLEAQIQPGDTLQALALRYNCTVSVKICIHFYYVTQSVLLVNIK